MVDVGVALQLPTENHCYLQHFQQFLKLLDRCRMPPTVYAVQLHVLSLLVVGVWACMHRAIHEAAWLNYKPCTGTGAPRDVECHRWL